MAYDYNKAKSAYEALNDAQRKQYDEANKNDANYQKFMQQYNAEKSQVSNVPTQTNVAKPEYQWAGTSTNTKYTNQWEGNYTYNPTSWYYEKQGTTIGWTSWASNTWTSPSYRATVTNQWNNLSYEQQQEKIKANPNLRSYLQQAGLTEKSAPVTETTWAETPTTPETPKTWDWWDYQDNSPERMSEIADNVNKFAITDPQLFENEDTFRNFFIDWKGRTPEQEKFLMDFYKNRKMYNTLDNYTAEQIGDKYVNGEIPESYLTYLKNTNPERYAYVMDAKAKAEDNIKYQTNYDTISNISWDGEDLMTSKVIQWLKDNWLLVDKDWNLIDDRREHYASEEENKYLKEIADLNARNLEIDNIVKHTYEDYVKKYPWATKATLMALAQDTNSDLLREKENNMVELTKFQWYVNYMQSERQEMNKAGADTIAQLQKDYGMYYQYSPEWLSELAQMQYAATNVTLDQADSWTYTQKQMALESVLSPIYEQYGSIIQRPMAQVINDVIAYAQNKWISLSQALDENFMTPLKSKPAYKQLSSAEPYTVKVGDVLYQYDFETWEFTPIGWTWAWLGTGLWWYQFWESIRTWDTIWNDINSIWHILASNDWLRVWTYKSSNWYTYNVYADREDGIKATENLLRKSYYGMSLQDAAQKWIWQWKDISDAKKVIRDKWLSLNDKLSDENVRKFIEAMWTWEWTLKWWETLDDWAKWWNNDFSAYKWWDTASASEQNSKFWWLAWWNSNWYSDNLVKDYELYISSPDKIAKTDIESKYAPMWMTYYDFTTQAQNYARTWMKDKYVNSVSSSLEAAIELYEYINWNQTKFQGKDLWNWSSLINDMFRWWNVQSGLLSKLYSYIPTTKQYDAKSFFDTLNNRETLQKLIETKSQWATYWAMSEWEWKLLASAANMLDRNQSWELFQKNLENLIYALSTAVEQWGGKLPDNYRNSSASKMIMLWENAWRWNWYKEDNTPFYADVDYSSYSTSWPSEI